MPDDDDDLPPDVIRPAQEVARRALALFACIGLAMGAERDDVVEWLADNDLDAELSPAEIAFLNAPEPSRRQQVDFSWQAERLVVLLWALGLVEMPAHDEQCDPQVLEATLPPYIETDARAFIAGAVLRSDDALLAMADDVLRLHWEARNAHLSGQPPRLPVDVEIVQERHHAINWIIGYDGADWDDVTTDT